MKNSLNYHFPISKPSYYLITVAIPMPITFVIYFITMKLLQAEMEITLLFLAIKIEDISVAEISPITLKNIQID